MKQFCDGRTDGRTDGPTEKWLIESRSTRLKTFNNAKMNFSSISPSDRRRPSAAYDDDDDDDDDDGDDDDGDGDDDGDDGDDGDDEKDDKHDKMVQSAS